MFIEFGDWLPDQPTLNNPGCIVAKNCLPMGRGYKPFPQAVTRSAVLTNRCRGAYTCTDSEKSPWNFAGDATKLYKLDSTTAIDYSGTPYTTDINEYWEFAKYGEYVVATNFNDPVQHVLLGGTQFSSLQSLSTGTVPKARHVAVVRDFLVFGNVENFSSRLVWSDKGDFYNWVVGGSSQSDSVDLIGDAGQIQRIVGGEFGLVFQRKSIWRMTYVGAPFFFQLDRVEQARGALVPGGVINTGAVTFFLDSDGFYAFNGSSVPIGTEKVNKWFFDNLSYGARERITSATDPDRPIVYWSFPSTASTDGTPDTIIAYNWATQRWSYISVTHEILSVLAIPAYTLEDLDAFGTMETLAYSLDSDYWRNGRLNLACFNTSHAWQDFTGAAMTAIIESGEVSLSGGNKTTVKKLLAGIDGATSPTFRVGARDDQGSAVSYSSALAPNTYTKNYTPRSTARFHRFEVTIANGFTDAFGIEVSAARRGNR